MSFQWQRIGVDDGGDLYINVYHSDGTITNIDVDTGTETAGAHAGTEFGRMFLTAEGDSITVGDQETANVDWMATGFSDCTPLARDFVKLYSPMEYGDLNLINAVVTWYADDKWKVRLVYGNEELTVFEQAAVCRITANTSGATQHITVANSHIQTVYAPGRNGGTNPHYGALNVTKNGADRDVEGLQVGARHMSFQVEAHYDPAVVTLAFWASIYALTYTQNSLPFLGFAAGEVLFTGADGGGDFTQLVPITFSFEVSPNETGVSIGNLPSFNKLGHDYFWAEYETADDIEQLVKKPMAGHIDRVYDPAAWTPLLLPC